MIPKVIHYCWFGGKPLPEDVKKYIKTWKKYCPDYKIIEWNEKNFDIHSNKYVEEAYESKKWAFITDYVRLYALYNYGGIYMDTDVELVKPLDNFLNDKAFSGFESETDVPTGLMASVKHHKFIKELLKYYDNRNFIKENGECDTTTNVDIITNICKKHGLKQNNTKQTINEFTFYPNDYFCPKSHKDFQIYKTTNTVAIHHFNGSWLSPAAKNRANLLKKLVKVFGTNFGSFLFRTVFLPYRLISNLRENGFKETRKKIAKTEKKK